MILLIKINICVFYYQKINYQIIIIVVDGSFFKKYLQFKRYMEEIFYEIVSQVNIIFMLFEDGLGKGVVLIAVVVSKINKV